MAVLKRFVAAGSGVVEALGYASSGKVLVPFAGFVSGFGQGLASSRAVMVFGFSARLLIVTFDVPFAVLYWLR